MFLVSSIWNKMWVYIPRVKLLYSYRKISCDSLLISFYRAPFINHLHRKERYFSSSISHVKFLRSMNRFQDSYTHIWPRWSQNISHRHRIALTPFRSAVNSNGSLIQTKSRPHQGSRRSRPRCEEIERVFMILFFCKGVDAILVCTRFHTPRFTILFLSWVAGRLDHVTSRTRYSSANVVVIQRD